MASSTVTGASAGGAPLYVDPSELTRTERILVAATPIVTLGSIIGLGYPPYAALTRWRIQHNPINGRSISASSSSSSSETTSTENKSYWNIIKSVREREGTRGLYKGGLGCLSSSDRLDAAASFFGRTHSVPAAFVPCSASRRSDLAECTLRRTHAHTHTRADGRLFLPSIQAFSSTCPSVSLPGSPSSAGMASCGSSQRQHRTC